MVFTRRKKAFHDFSNGSTRARENRQKKSPLESGLETIIGYSRTGRKRPA
jgi:hypothetical protein